MVQENTKKKEDSKEQIEKLYENDQDFIDLYKVLFGPNNNRSINERVMSEIRTFWDDANSQFLQRKAEAKGRPKVS